MAITGVISLARAGETVQIFQNPSDLNDIFDPNASPSLQPFDHVTLYPGDFTDIDPIEIKDDDDVYLTILPGAQVEYTFALEQLDKAKRLADRYQHINGAVQNVADLNIAHLYETTVEKQLARVRRYKNGSGESLDDGMTPFAEYNNLDDAAEDANEGETVVVFPGDYEPENNLLADGVTWKFLPGSTVTFEPSYGTSTYPHALFDDSKNANGVSENSSVEAKIYGDGEFIIGREEETQTKLAETNSDWDNWHKYSLIAVSNAASEITFEADQVKVKKFDEQGKEIESKIDGVIKYANAKSLDINIRELRFGSKVDVGDNVSGGTLFGEREAPFPAFLIVNGFIGSSAENEVIDIDIENVFIEEGENSRESFPYLVSGVNPNDNNGFSGELKAIFENHTGLEEERAIYFPSDAGHFPEQLLLEDSEIRGEVFFAGSSQTTKLILKESEIYDSSEAPVILAGNSSALDVSLSEAWLLSDGGTYSIKNETGDTAFEIKVYQNSFANLPVQDFKQVLHDELNNVAWSEDVGSIR
jgi:hypothetical protein